MNVTILGTSLGRHVRLVQNTETRRFTVRCLFCKTIDNLPDWPSVNGFRTEHLHTRKGW